MFEGFYTSPPSYANIRRAVWTIKQKHPAVKVFPIGKSVLGRSLYAIGIGEIYNATLLVGGVHGMEWLTTLLLVRLAEDILHAIEHRQPLAEIDVAAALENRALVIIPCLNPDGVEISIGGAQTAGHLAPFVQKTAGKDTVRWQANARGIDLNHNFDAGFAQLKELERQAGFLQPGPTRYGGTTPHSEPESRALVHFCTAFGIRQAYAYHSQGEEIYYQYGENTPAQSELMAQVLACASGYRLAQPEEIASHGGFKDWFIEHMHRPAFTIEIGRGSNPLPVEEFEPIYARLLEMMLISILL